MASSSSLAAELDLIAAPFTPFRADGALNLAPIEAYAEKLDSQGVTGVFVCGTTGEGMSLTLQERRKSAEAWKSAVNGRMRLIVHVGHTCTQEAQALAKHAQEIGADGIAAIGPIFFTPSSPKALVALNKEIAQAAPETPFYSYHMPSMSRSQFPVSSWFAAMAEAIPTFRGVKFTHDDIEDFKRCLALAGDRYELLFGRDELLYNALDSGARGAVGSTYNFAAPLYRKIARAYRAGDPGAQRLQALCSEAIGCMVRFGGLPAIKATLGLSGVDCGPLRLPLEPLTRKNITALGAELNELGFFDAIASAALT